MPSINILVESKVSDSIRAKQVQAAFDVPLKSKTIKEWKGELPIDNIGWNIGLIVGPSGCGKSTIAKQLWPELIDKKFTWEGESVIDDFPQDKKLEDITRICGAVGFNTIPSWLKPFSVLSTGEKFRVEMARHLIESPDLSVVDEFTSVIDRQVAQIGSYAIQKHVRRKDQRFVAVTCHSDVVDWLNPDWTFYPETMEFIHNKGCLRQIKRPQVKCEIKRIAYKEWNKFSQFHYMNSEMSQSAKCWGMFIDGTLSTFAGIIHRPHNIAKNIKAITRIVTLPDWQGLGLTMEFIKHLGSIYRAAGYRLRGYPAHPALIHAVSKTGVYKLRKKPVIYKTQTNKDEVKKMRAKYKGFSTEKRPCAVFEYTGPEFEDVELAKALVNEKVSSL